MGIQRPRNHARRERGEVLPQAPREREARQARSFPPRRRTLRRRNRDRQRASIQKATWHRSGATDRTTELVADTGGWIFGPAMSAPQARMTASMRRMWQGPITARPFGLPASSAISHNFSAL